ncbi:MAG TPA: YfiR family protein [Candidatus Binatia bacterium]|jgi:hypothetical protein|nr:YfiR family protein [Candidatus Binatia bacterium]
MGLLTILPGVAAGVGSRARAASRHALQLVALWMAFAFSVATAAENEALEYAVKAAYLSKFRLYVEWPNTAFPSASTALTLCVAGEDPFGAALDKAVGEERANRPIVVRRLKTVGRDSGCHILYIGGSDPARTRQVIDAVRGSSVLTVSDARSVDTGTVINFVIKDNRVRFDIDEEAAAQNGLTISSKLLSLALNVRRTQSRESR